MAIADALPIAQGEIFGMRLKEIVGRHQAGEGVDAVLAFPAVLKEPTPTVYLSNYGASSIEYTIRCWTAADAYWDTYFKMYERLRNTFAEHNVEMSYDHLNVHVVPEKQNEN